MTRLHSQKPAPTTLGVIEMKKVKHWLHILLTILTSGLWLPVYLILLANTEMFNRGYREGKAAGRVQRQNEIDEERAYEKMPGPQHAMFFGKGDAGAARYFSGLAPECREVAYFATTPINETATSEAVQVAEFEMRAKSKTMRYLDLCDLRRKGDIASWSPMHETEYQQLKTELQR